MNRIGPQVLAASLALHGVLLAEERPRIRDLGVRPGVLTPGPGNAITDVAGVRVGHRTIVEGDAIRTGVTAVVPHSGNLFQQKAPAAVYVGNGFGKAAGSAGGGTAGITRSLLIDSPPVKVFQFSSVNGVSSGGPGWFSSAAASSGGSCRSRCCRCGSPGGPRSS